jgi:hypothetical protein
MVVLVLAFTGGYLLWYLFKYLTNAKPSAKTIENDLKQMRKESEEEFVNLVPWTKDEWSLLSATLGEHKEFKGIIKRADGVMKSIYHEPLLLYRYKQYAGGKHSLLLIRTRKFEFVFWKKGKRTEIFKNSEAFGIMDEEGNLLSKNGKKQVGRLKQPDENTFIPVVLHEHEVANISHPKKIDTVNPRAFEFLSDLAEEDQEKLFALTLSYYVKERIPFAKNKHAGK